MEILYHFLTILIAVSLFETYGSFKLCRLMTSPHGISVESKTALKSDSNQSGSTSNTETYSRTQTRSRRKRSKSATTADNTNSGISEQPNNNNNNTNEISINVEKSKLTPVRGTNEDIQQKYLEKSAVLRYFDELSQPTPVGKEPKAVELIKAVTWFSIIALVVVEIFISIKSGSSPSASSVVSTPFPSLQELSYPGQ